MRIKTLASTLACLAVVGGLGALGYAFFKDMTGPSITISPDFDRTSPQREISITAEDPSNIRSISVSVRKNNASTRVFHRSFDEHKPSETITFTLKDAGIREGAFDLEVKAADASLAGFGQGNTTTRSIAMQLDTTPPRLSVTTRTPYVRRGGTGVIRYTVNENVSSSGVRVGDMFFPGYQQADNSYICFFAFPYNKQVKEFSPQITAEDIAGNTVTRTLSVYPMNRVFKEDTINVTDQFLEKVSNVLSDLAPNAPNHLERFLTINKDIRAANVQFLNDLGKETTSQIQWSGAFARLPRSAARASFADHRTYIYNGKKIDDQSHLGFDLASLANADVPAANNGRVVFTGYLGIYGNLVVIDHGLGLMSLYSHLSNIQVKTGDTVKKGDTIAQTGSTGMAFGDHLHFGILVGGVEVTPLEWLDPKWIRDNVTDRLAAQ